MMMAANCSQALKISSGAMYSEANNAPRHQNIITCICGGLQLQDGDNSFKVNVPYTSMLRKQYSNTVVSQKSKEEVLIQIQYRTVSAVRTFFFFFLMGFLATLQARFIFIPFRFQKFWALGFRPPEHYYLAKVPRANVDLLFV